MSKRTTVLGLAVVLALAAAAAFAQGLVRGPGMTGTARLGPANAWPISDWTQALGLTPEQAQQIEGLRKQTADRTAGLREKMQTLRTEIWTLRQEGASPEQLESKFQQVNGLLEEMWKARAGFHEGLANILTQEQLAKLPLGAGHGMGLGAGPMGGRGFGHGMRGMAGGWCHSDQPCPGPQNCPYQKNQ